MRIKKQIIISIIRDKKKPKGKPSVFSYLNSSE